MCLRRVKFVFFRYNFTLGRALFEMQKDFEEVNNRTLLYSVNAELIMIRFKYRVQYLAQIGYFPEHVAEKLSKVFCPRYRQDQFYGINPNITTIIAGFFYLLLPQRFPENLTVTNLARAKALFMKQDFTVDSINRAADDIRMQGCIMETFLLWPRGSSIHNQIDVDSDGTSIVELLTNLMLPKDTPNSSYARLLDFSL